MGIFKAPRYGVPFAFFEDAIFQINRTALIMHARPNTQNTKATRKGVL
jgi:hypothetical protein